MTRPIDLIADIVSDAQGTYETAFVRVYIISKYNEIFPDLSINHIISTIELAFETTFDSAALTTVANISYKHHEIADGLAYYHTLQFTYGEVDCTVEINFSGVD